MSVIETSTYTYTHYMTFFCCYKYMVNVLQKDFSIVTVKYSCIDDPHTHTYTHSRGFSFVIKALEKIEKQSDGQTKRTYPVFKCSVPFACFSFSLVSPFFGRTMFHGTFLQIEEHIHAKQRLQCCSVLSKLSSLSLSPSLSY